jgi:hypothetical protein
MTKRHDPDDEYWEKYKQYSNGFHGEADDLESLIHDETTAQNQKHKKKPPKFYLADTDDK